MEKKIDRINSSSISDCLKELSEEYYDLHPSEVPVIDHVPSPLEFSKKWLSQNFPVIIKNAVSHWPALLKWDYDYLSSKLRSPNISVAVTPNGFADAVFNNLFVMPEETSMAFDDFIYTLKNPKECVYYIQKQNNNLFEEFSMLHSDVDHHIPWATEALGREPDAVNFWMGDGRAVTSLHKDHYENIYCVVRGKKEFILHPPIDAPWIPYESYDAAVYVNADKGVHMNHLNEKVKWIPIDPLNPDLKRYPQYKNAHQYYCVVEEGDALYLPSLWFHHVRQSHGCIAVNYWYDMDYNAKYCHFKFLENLGHLLNGAD